MKKTVVNTVIVLLLLAAAVVFMIPEVESFIIARQNTELILDFQKKADIVAEAQKQGQEQLSEPELSEPVESDYGQLLHEMRNYNESIYQQKQVGISDAWDEKDENFDFTLVEDLEDLIGYLTIEAMNIELPLYMGASTENMAKGAAVLNQTSFPVGGINTNCVIAAHRRYRGAPMFGDIEKLKPGDEIKLTNLWETLSYRVVKCIVISPDDIETVKIIDGQDMITLVTCHPYGKNYQRYVVYCVRADVSQQDNMTELINEDILSEDVFPSGQEYQSSQADIDRDFWLNRIGAVAAVAILLVIFMGFIYCNFFKKQRHKK
ncbi:MAG: class C sortase [Clostridiales bacterium]|nr:class C sortase [Clostridiales bacterium]